MAKKSIIYWDTAAATPLDLKVKRAMLPYLDQVFANPSSLHFGGVSAGQALNNARQLVAEVLGARPQEIIFTGSGTEANNLALSIGSGQILTSTIEHASILSPCRARGASGNPVAYVPVLGNGLIDLEAFRSMLNPETKLVSLMYANNEIGTIQPLRAVAKIVRSHRKHFKTIYPYFHTDACQATRFLDLNVARLGVDLMTINAAKMYGPKGVGALYVREGVSIVPLIYGGGQERGRRAGTENVAGIIGLAGALELARQHREREVARLTPLRDRLISGLLKLSGTTLQGDATERLPNNVNVAFDGILAEQLVIELDAKGVACSTGSACSITDHNESHVVMALGQSRERAEQSVRFTFGRDVTARDVDYVLKVIPPILKKLRSRV